MYTVIWIDEQGHDRWERCQSTEEVNALLDQENCRCEDTWIFLPDADDYAIEGNIFDEERG